MDMQIEEVKEIKTENLQDFAPENLQHSKLLPYINEHLLFKISDFNLVYHKTQEDSLNILKNCNFLKISEDTVSYDDEEINCVFICDESLLNKKLLKLEQKFNEDKKTIKRLKEDPEAIVEVARERYFMKTPQEDIFIIEDKHEKK